MNHQVARVASTSAAWRVAGRQLCQVLRQAERLGPHSGLDLDSTWSVWRNGATTWELRDGRTLLEDGERYGPPPLGDAIDRWLAFLEDGTEFDLERASCVAAGERHDRAGTDRPAKEARPC